MILLKKSKILLHTNLKIISLDYQVIFRSVSSKILDLLVKSFFPRGKLQNCQHDNCISFVILAILDAFQRYAEKTEYLEISEYKFENSFIKSLE